MSIPFTQYLRPNGRTRDVSIDLPDEVEGKAGLLIAAGCRFEIEELTTGMISATCERDEDTLAHQISPNGIPLISAIQTLVETAYQRIAN